VEKVLKFQRRYGGAWVPIKLHRNAALGSQPRKMSLCEAVSVARRSPLTLAPDSVNCPGALYSLGWDQHSDTTAVMALLRANNISAPTAGRLLESVHRLDGQVQAISLGTEAQPDMIISYAQPQAVMDVLFDYQQLKGEAPALEMPCVLSVCGSGVAKAAQTGDIAISFGCQEARDRAGITRDRLVVVVPYHLVEQLVTLQGSTAISEDTTRSIAKEQSDGRTIQCAGD